MGVAIAAVVWRSRESGQADARPRISTAVRRAEDLRKIEPNADISDTSPAGILNSARDRGKKDEVLQRRFEAEMHVKHTFGKVISSLHLSAADDAKLRHLLVEHSLVAWDAHDILEAQAAPPSGPRDYSSFIKLAQGDVLDEIKREFPAEVFENVRQMLQVTRPLTQIDYFCVPVFDAAGVSLTADQYLPLAQILSKNYRGVGPQLRPSLDETRDADSLVERDRSALREL
ncbi:MAG: hypothetical protein JWM88_2699, partial [Verrucomicrobia bacterium]|nr:hypothetical protein [Verrucomicrobiota bacterium]